MSARNERDFYSFEDLGGGDWARRVVGKSGSMLADVTYDSVSVAYPTSITEVYSFFDGGLSGTLKATLTLTYTNGSKTDLSSAVRT